MPNTTDNPYDDSPPTGPEEAPPAAEETPPADESQQEQGEAETTVVPKAFFGEEVKPGDTCTIRVESVGENEVVVTYEGEPGKEEGQESGRYGPGGPPSELRDLME